MIFRTPLLLVAIATHVGCAHVAPPPRAVPREPAAPFAVEVEAARPRDEAPAVLTRPFRCGKAREGGPVLGVGSSTMGGVLGLALRRGLEPAGIRFTKWAKSASSVVRPDFFDWARELETIVPKLDPAVVIIELGTNDNQAIWPRRGRGIPPTDRRWEEAFVTLAEEIITRAAGEDGRRIVIWIGPYAFRGKGSRVIGRRINELLRERLEARHVAAYYVDAYTTTLDPTGRPIETFVPPGTKKPVPARGIDGIHLKTAVVKAVMADPALAIVRQCVGPRG